SDGIGGADVIDEAFKADAVVPAKDDTRAFWKWNALVGASMAYDVSITGHCLAVGACHEMNPLLGSNPSMARLWGSSVPMLAGQIALTYYLRKHHDNHWRRVPL